MNTTPLWVPILVGGLGLFGTVIAGLGGVWLTQRGADRREAVAWERQIEREHAQWAREDAARTFEFRRSAYVDFYQAAFAALMLLATYAGKITRREVYTDDPEVAARDADLQNALDVIQIYGTPKVLALAQKVQQGLFSSRVIVSQMHVANIDDELGKQSEAGGTALLELHTAIREELGVPDDDSPDAEAWRARFAWMLRGSAEVATADD
ncbi:hypothetical protein [Mycolicibacterium setense]